MADDPRDPEFSVGDPGRGDFSVGDPRLSYDSTRRADGADATPQFRVRCPFCRERVSVSDNELEQEIACPACGSRFNLAANASTASRGTPPPKLGHFQLLDQLGQGQFGLVWKAHDTTLDRVVALKIPRRSRLDDGELEMFVREARAAAQLSHPNIVSVYEVGREDDIVYIASDFVQGADVRQWLASRQPTYREIAALCAKVADALHHAHEAGVIHRDLKPANIMLDLEGQPKIMDFGLARRDTGEVTVTLDGQVLGTPAYMSPEQAAGEGHTADRRTDIFSLGVMLYEMLAGERPFRGEKQMLIMQILSEDPRPPRRLNQRIPRDLETICLKCLEKEPHRRYDTAAAVAADLRAWLNKEPIQARPISRTGRLLRWCQRRPAVAGLLAAVILVTVVGFALVSWQANIAGDRAVAFAAERDRSEEYLEKLLESVDQMLVDVGADRLQDEPHMEETRRLLIEEALAFYDWLATQDVDNPRIRRLHIKALAQGGELHRYLGEYQASREALETATRLLADGLQGEPADSELLQLKAQVTFERSNVAWDAGDTVQAAAFAREVLEVGDALSPAERQTALPLIGDAMLRLAEIARAAGNSTESESWLRQTIDLLETTEDSSSRHREVLLKSHHDLANQLGYQAGKQEEAERHFRRTLELTEAFPSDSVDGMLRTSAVLGDFAQWLAGIDRVEEAKGFWARDREIRERLVAEHPSAPHYRYHLALHLQGYGYELFQRDWNNGVEQRDEYLADVQRAIDILTELVKEYPGTFDYEDTLANTYNLLGICHRDNGDPDKAESAYRASLAFLDSQLAKEPDNPPLNSRTAAVLNNLARIEGARGNYAQALELVRRAIERQRVAVDTDPDNLQYLQYLRNQLSTQALCLAFLDRQPESIACRTECIEVAELLWAGNPTEQNEAYLRGQLTVRSSNVADQTGLLEASYRQALDDIERALSLTHSQSDLDLARFVAAALHLRLGDPEPLLRWGQEFENAEDKAEWYMQWAWVALAGAQTGDVAAAQRYLDRVAAMPADHLNEWYRRRTSRIAEEARLLLSSPESANELNEDDGPFLQEWATIPKTAFRNHL